MSEMPLGGPRHWLEFPDPEGDPQDPETVFRVDLTWLTSRWTCIYGAGCPGICADRPDDGCCTLGTHYSDDDDRRRVERASGDLTADLWQYLTLGRAGGVSELDADGEPKTRVVDGACVFLNRSGFPGGAGCALHKLALGRGEPITRTKPDVCWQLPIRRAYSDVTRPDGTIYQVVEIGEFDRRGWGEGGHDLDWFCTTAPAAHVGVQPVYMSCRDELVELLGVPAYDVLVEHCRAREETFAHRVTRGLPIVGLAPHPASHP